MPGKSRRRRGASSIQSKKGRNRQSRSTKLAPQPAAAQSAEPAARLAVSAPSINMPATAAKPTAPSYPYIAAELRTIGILAGLMLIILVVLAWRLA